MSKHQVIMILLAGFIGWFLPEFIKPLWLAIIFSAIIGIGLGILGAILRNRSEKNETISN